MAVCGDHCLHSIGALHLTLYLHNFERNDGPDGWRSIVSNIQVAKGAHVGVLGSCGSGKTDLSYLLTGLQPSSKSRAHITLNDLTLTEMSDEHRSRQTAFVPSDPYQMFSGMKSTLADEFDIGMQILGDVSEYAHLKVEHTIAAFGLRPLLQRDPFTLSGGEAVRAAVGLAVWKRPTVVVLDQLFDALHPEWRATLKVALDAVLGSNAIVVETHARVPAWAREWSAVLDLSSRMSASDVWSASLRLEEAPTPHLAQPGPALRATSITFSYGPGDFALGPIDFKLERGEICALLGPNGSGKSTLAKCFSLINRPSSGTICAYDLQSVPQGPYAPGHEHLWAKHVRYVFQNPDEQLFRSSVRAEVGIGRGSDEFIEAKIAIIAGLGLSQYLDASPFSLPRPLRRLVSLASALCDNPAVLILDEPTVSLDSDQTMSLWQEICRYVERGGSVLMITHDQAIHQLRGVRCLQLADGRLKQ